MLLFFFDYTLLLPTGLYYRNMLRMNFPRIRDGYQTLALNMEVSYKKLTTPKTAFEGVQRVTPASHDIVVRPHVNHNLTCIHLSVCVV